MTDGFRHDTNEPHSLYIWRAHPTLISKVSRIWILVILLNCFSESKRDQNKVLIILQISHHRLHSKEALRTGLGNLLNQVIIWFHWFECQRGGKKGEEPSDFKPGAFLSPPRFTLQMNGSQTATSKQGFCLSFINSSNCLSFSRHLFPSSQDASRNNALYCTQIHGGKESGRPSPGF